MIGVRLCLRILRSVQYVPFSVVLSKLRAELSLAGTSNSINYKAHLLVLIGAADRVYKMLLEILQSIFSARVKVADWLWNVEMFVSHLYCARGVFYGLL